MRASLFFAALLGPFALAAPTVTLTTPHGERPAGNVHLVPKGGHVRHSGNEVHLIGSHGAVLHRAKNDGSSTSLRTKTSSKRAEKSGWVAYAGWSNTGRSPISYFDTTWTVPPAPKTYHGQTVFLFNSIEPKDGNAILQPVVQYGPSAAGGGAYWGVASWYLVGKQTYHTPLIRVNPGQVLHGVMTLENINGLKFDYISQFSNIAHTNLRASGAAQLTWATETLEAYQINKRSDYPAGSTVFSDINVKTRAGIPHISWSAVSDLPDTLKTTVNTDGAYKGKITIDY